MSVYLLICLSVYTYVHPSVHLSSIYFFWLHLAACRISVSQPGVECMPHVVEALSLNQCTTREVYLSVGLSYLSVYLPTYLSLSIQPSMHLTVIYTSAFAPIHPSSMCVYMYLSDFLGGSVVKNPPAVAGDMGSIPGSGRSPAKGNCNPLQYSCLGNPMGRGTWWATVHGFAKEYDSGTKQQQRICLSVYLSKHHYCKEVV